VSEPRFLKLEDVLEQHELTLERYGGLSGVRDQNGLESAVQQPKNTYYYGHGDIFDVAAAYAFHIAQAQAFLDGNKRAGVSAALGFLEINKVQVRTDDLELYRMVMEIAERRCDKVQLAAMLRNSAVT
jgi:death-on-curing protein